MDKVGRARLKKDDIDYLIRMRGAGPTYTRDWARRRKNYYEVEPYLKKHGEKGLQESLDDMDRARRGLVRVPQLSSSTSSYFTKDPRELAYYGLTPVQPIAKSRGPSPDALARAARIQRAGEEIGRLERLKQKYLSGRRKTVDEIRVPEYRTRATHRPRRRPQQRRQERQQQSREREHTPEQVRTRQYWINRRLKAIDAQRPNGNFVTITDNKKNGDRLSVVHGVRYEYTKYKGVYYSRNQNGEYWMLGKDRWTVTKLSNKPSWVKDYLKPQARSAGLEKGLKPLEAGEFSALFEEKHDVKEISMADIDKFLREFKKEIPSLINEHKSLFIPLIQERYPKLSKNEAAQFIHALVETIMPHMDSIVRFLASAYNKEIQELKEQKITIAEGIGMLMKYAESNSAELEKRFSQLEQVFGVQLNHNLKTNYPVIYEKIGGKRAVDELVHGKKKQNKQPEKRSKQPAVPEQEKLNADTHVEKFTKLLEKITSNQDYRELLREAQNTYSNLSARAKRDIKKALQNPTIQRWMVPYGLRFEDMGERGFKIASEKVEIIYDVHKGISVVEKKQTKVEKQPEAPKTTEQKIQEFRKKHRNVIYKGVEVYNKELEFNIGLTDDADINAAKEKIESLGIAVVKVMEDIKVIRCEKNKNFTPESFLLLLEAIEPFFDFIEPRTSVEMNINSEISSDVPRETVAAEEEQTKVGKQTEVPKTTEEQKPINQNRDRVPSKSAKEKEPVVEEKLSEENQSPPERKQDEESASVSTEAAHRSATVLSMNEHVKDALHDKDGFDIQHDGDAILYSVKHLNLLEHNPTVKEFVSTIAQYHSPEHSSGVRKIDNRSYNVRELDNAGWEALAALAEKWDREGDGIEK